MPRIRHRLSTLAATVVLVIGSGLALATPAHADNGTVITTDFNSAGHPIGAQDNTWVNSKNCQTDTVPGGTAMLQVSNLSTAPVKVFAGPNCTGTPFGTVEPFSLGTTFHFVETFPSLEPLD
ncbi:hypothetical protein [Streptomyces natalensis]|uniref:Lipoprotein n=1 Tax=Streptomyces natalensis ATCC 27448 TaxID=1240678 RepID=A0A0D7CVF0_9ACTN|nr:hypothetical protein [Streptomyces natalensis]KIZ19805.1 hypothetical protein SNA_00050 [Streptomyces natalensis ATCC 27448]